MSMSADWNDSTYLLMRRSPSTWSMEKIGLEDSTDFTKESRRGLEHKEKLVDPGMNDTECGSVEEPVNVEYDGDADSE